MNFLFCSLFFPKVDLKMSLFSLHSALKESLYLSPCLLGDYKSITLIMKINYDRQYTHSNVSHDQHYKSLSSIIQPDLGVSYYGSGVTESVA